MPSQKLVRLRRILLALVIYKRQRERRQRLWSHEINLTRSLYGEFHTLYPSLRKDEDRFHIYFRMNFNSFDKLLNLIEDGIEKQSTNWRETIPPVERLAITLRYLATGDSYKTIGHSFHIGFSTVSLIIHEVCPQIWVKLQPLYMPEPTCEIWECNISGFMEKWRFPNCMGCIDGKHVTIKAFKNTGSDYFCYLKKFSFVLLAIVGYDYKFIIIDVGAYGKNNDSGIFDDCAMGKKFESRTMNVPPDRPLPDQTQPTSCVLLGDKGFGLYEYLLRPFSHKQALANDAYDLFNERLCRTRRIVENDPEKFRVQI